MSTGQTTVTTADRAPAPGCNRLFLTSVPGILSIVATALGLGAFIALELYKKVFLDDAADKMARAGNRGFGLGGVTQDAIYKAYWKNTDELVFHEFTTTASWVVLLLLLIFIALRLHALLRLTNNTLKIVVLVNAALWCFLVLLSSALLLAYSSMDASFKLTAMWPLLSSWNDINYVKRRAADPTYEQATLIYPTELYATTIIGILESLVLFVLSIILGRDLCGSKTILIV